ncbi:hypothetical protein K0G05_22735, partial [Phocaeicola vulgatus]|nr:hypothetical protein [Phocaeicola vulgatus]
IDTFSASTGEKLGKYLIPTFPGSPGHGRKKNIIMIPKNNLIVFFSLLFGRVFRNLYICVCRN